MVAGTTDNSVRVVGRFRPINNREREEWKDKGENGDPTCVDFVADNTVRIRGAPHALDKFFDMSTNQEKLFDFFKPTCQDVLAGFNGTIFAFGQTGSGKTYTMFGANINRPEDEQHQGIIPRATTFLFDQITKNEEVDEVTVKFSMLEIYREQVRDLLKPKGPFLRVRESPDKSTYCEGLTTEFVTSVQEVFRLIKIGNKSRSVAATRMNAASSRSHTLLTLTVQQKAKDGSTKRGKLHFADLAGSEKTKKTGASGDTLKEANKINQSLSALGNCIKALTTAKSTHVPFRDSKLTFILKDSLGGNCKTTLLVCASPHPFNVEETISTLRFGARAKKIKTSATVNKQRSVAECMVIIGKLKADLSKAKQQVTKYRGIIDWMKSPDYDPDSPPPNLRIDADSSSPASLDSTVVEAKFQEAQADISDLKTELSQVQADLAATQEATEERESLLEERIKQADDERTRLDEDRTRLQYQLDVTSKKLDQQKREFSEADDARNQAQAEQAALRERIGTIEQAELQLKSSLAQMQQERNVLQDGLQQARDKMADLEDEFSRASSRWENERSAASQQVALLQQQNQALQKDISAANAKIAQMTLETAQQNATVSELSKTMHELDQDLEEEEEDEEDQQSENGDDSRRALTRRASRRKMSSLLDESRARQRARSESLVGAGLSDEADDAPTSPEASSVEVTVLQNALAKAQSEHSNLQATGEQQQTTIDMLKSQLGDVEKSLKRKSDLVEEKQAKHQERQDELQTQLKGVIANQGRLCLELQKTQACLDEKHAQTVQFGKRDESMKEQLAEQHNIIDSCERQIARERAHHEIKDKTIGVLREQCRRLEQDNADLKSTWEAHIEMLVADQSAAQSSHGKFQKAVKRRNSTHESHLQTKASPPPKQRCIYEGSLQFQRAGSSQFEGGWGCLHSNQLEIAASRQDFLSGMPEFKLFFSPETIISHNPNAGTPDFEIISAGTTTVLRAKNAAFRSQWIFRTRETISTLVAPKLRLGLWGTIKSKFSSPQRQQDNNQRSSSPFSSSSHSSSKEDTESSPVT